MSAEQHDREKPLRWRGKSGEKAVEEGPLSGVLRQNTRDLSVSTAVDAAVAVVGDSGPARAFPRSFPARLDHREHRVVTDRPAEEQRFAGHDPNEGDGAPTDIVERVHAVCGQRYAVVPDTGPGRRSHETSREIAAVVVGAP
ncbi:hypothetical protein F0L17_23815 [Streptomyces sp. TRM43335]|uniref:Uncharacterized protein n=1 Tax=Streptomyces taklimakanensis TaxID=2569853 RepID=A0A6G2BIK8_9ACTN|nr:hypothetical protein [Streptomyces taklimakanensis]MTE22080.1 hypothetical protein [Streptomyces taklimakanensis]